LSATAWERTPSQHRVSRVGRGRQSLGGNPRVTKFFFTPPSSSSRREPGGARRGLYLFIFHCMHHQQSVQDTISAWAPDSAARVPAYPPLGETKPGGTRPPGTNPTAPSRRAGGPSPGAGSLARHLGRLSAHALPLRAELGAPHGPHFLVYSSDGTTPCPRGHGRTQRKVRPLASRPRERPASHESRGLFRAERWAGYHPTVLAADFQLGPTPTRGEGPAVVSDPSAGSPTETLLRLLLPLSGTVRTPSRGQAGVKQGSPL
jgi:hypothetical protein